MPTVPKRAFTVTENRVDTIESVLLVTCAKWIGAIDAHGGAGGWEW